jgi:hypothetical protein
LLENVGIFEGFHVGNPNAPRWADAAENGERESVAMLLIAQLRRDQKECFTGVHESRDHELMPTVAQTGGVK